MAQRDQGWGMPRRAPRVMSWDQILALMLVVPVCLVLGLLWPVSLICQGRPFLYASRRAGRDGVPFRLWKVRTMHVTGAGERVLGGDSDNQVTPLGSWLRWSRIDELPQIFNVLRGDMRFVGPRPPLMRYFEGFPEVYEPVLQRPPGITGLATVLFCQREERILAPARSAEEADAIYRRRCLPRKARLDRMFQRRDGPGLTAMVLVLTLWRGPAAQRTLRRLRHALRQRVPRSNAVAEARAPQSETRAPARRQRGIAQCRRTSTPLAPAKSADRRPGARAF